MTESVFLDCDFIHKYLSTLKEIKNRQIVYNIKKSNRSFSRSIYIRFYAAMPNGVWNKVYMLRISDHITKKENYIRTFLIDPDKPLKKKRKLLFFKILKESIAYTKIKHTKYLIKRISRELEKSEKYV